MKVAFIAPFGLQPKATASARMLPLAHALARRGHSVRIIVPPWDDPSARAGTRSIAPNVQVVTLPLPKRVPSSIAFTYGLVRSALSPFAGARDDAHLPDNKQPNLSRPDVVHVFKPIGYSGLAGLALHGLGVPWMLDVDDWEGPGGWADVNRYSPAQKLAATFLEALLPRLAGAVTAASRTLESRAWGFGLPRRRVFYLPNGVSADKYAAWLHPAPAAPLRIDGAPTLLLYTRFAEFPYTWPLDILKHVLEEHPTAKLLVVGSGFFEEEAKLQAEAAQYGLQDHLTITGRVPEVDLPAYLSQGDVALYPMSDNLINRAKSPVKLLEPMVMGLPIVAHRVGQVTEFLGDTGVLVQPGDVRGMAVAASTLLSNPDKRKQLGESARKRVWAEFNWEKLSGVAEVAYSSLAAS
ncbi:MAG TPA: glycosyltransferase family 4 protein [Chloroflexia bacterium]|jgi:glycosyltransferase involved in cell wall biosynthesis